MSELGPCVSARAPCMIYKQPWNIRAFARACIITIMYCNCGCVLSLECARCCNCVCFHHTSNWNTFGSNRIVPKSQLTSFDSGYTMQNCLNQRKSIENEVIATINVECSQCWHANCECNTWNRRINRVFTWNTCWAQGHSGLIQTKTILAERETRDNERKSE